MTKQEIGQILKSAREAKGLTQKQVAEQIGRGQQIVGHWETGYAQPDANTLFVLCDIYGISIDEAFKNKPSKQAKSSPSKEALELAAAFDTLNPVGQSLVRSALDFALKHLAGNQPPLKRIGTTLNPTSGQRLPLYEVVCDGTIETKEAAKAEQAELNNELQSETTSH